VLFKQYHLRRLDEPFLLVTARSGTSTLRSPGSAQVIVVYSLGPSCASILASAPDKALWITPEVNRWLDKNKRVTLHFTPTSGSWLNMVEIFFGIITRQAIRRGTFTSVKDLIAAIEIFIDGWNERCEPFIWTKTADQILPHATGGKRSSIARH
jgi:hypothetical protein